MGDKYYTNSLFLEVAHHGEELLHFAVVQGGGRLVKNQHLAVHIHRAGNGNHLLDGQGVIFEILRDIHMDVETFYQFVGPLEHGPAIDGAKGCHGLAADVQVFRNAEVGTEIDFLIHGRDTDPLGVQGRAVLYRAVHTVHTDLAGLKIVDAGEALDEGGLTGAIFTHEGMDLTLA